VPLLQPDRCPGESPRSWNIITITGLNRRNSETPMRRILTYVGILILINVVLYLFKVPFFVW
jgi:hypothetical protein